MLAAIEMKILRYGMDAEDAPPPPELPDWCYEEEVKKTPSDCGQGTFKYSGKCR